MATSLQTAPRIFISHSHKNNDFGLALVQDLRQALGDDNGVWYDAKGGLHGGDNWWMRIKEEIKARSVFIVTRVGNLFPHAGLLIMDFRAG